MLVELQQKKNKISENLPFTQSLAQLKLILGKDYKDVPCIKNKNFTDLDTLNTLRDNVHAFLYKFQENYKIHNPDRKILANISESQKTIDQIMDMLIKEKLNDDKLVLYTGSTPEVGFISDLETILYDAFTGENHSDVSTLRGSDEAFGTFSNVDDFVKWVQLSQNTYVTNFNYANGYVKRGISANPSLFGNWDHSGSCSLNYWIFARNEHPLPPDELIKDVLEKVGLPEDKIKVRTKELIEVLRKYFPDYISEKYGYMFQVFLTKEQMDQCTYLAEISGPFIRLPSLSNKNQQNNSHPSEVLTYTNHVSFCRFK